MALQNVSDNLHTRLAIGQSKAQSCLTDLPPEILRIILSYLDVNSLLECRRVNVLLREISTQVCRMQQIFLASSFTLERNMLEIMNLFQHPSEIPWTALKIKRIPHNRAIFDRFLETYGPQIFHIKFGSDVGVEIESTLKKTRSIKSLSFYCDDSMFIDSQASAESTICLPHLQTAFFREFLGKSRVLNCATRFLKRVSCRLSWITLDYNESVFYTFDGSQFDDFLLVQLAKIPNVSIQFGARTHPGALTRVSNSTLHLTKCSVYLRDDIMHDMEALLRQSSDSLQLLELFLQLQPCTLSFETGFLPQLTTLRLHLITTSSTRGVFPFTTVLSNLQGKYFPKLHTLAIQSSTHHVQNGLLFQESTKFNSVKNLLCVGENSLVRHVSNLQFPNVTLAKFTVTESDFPLVVKNWSHVKAISLFLYLRKQQLIRTDVELNRILFGNKDATLQHFEVMSRLELIVAGAELAPNENPVKIVRSAICKRLCQLQALDFLGFGNIQVDPKNQELLEKKHKTIEYNTRSKPSLKYWY